MAQIYGAMRKTPLFQLNEPGMALLAKLEYYGMVGSIKDRPALWILKSAIERGDITSETTVVESSSGNFALALATFCSLLGIRFVPVIDPNISKSNESALRASCETVVKVEERDDTGGFLKTRLAKVDELRRSLPHVFWPNQYANPDSAMAHYHLTAGEICEGVPRLDFVFVPVSTGGTIAGVSRRLKEHYPGIKIIAADAEGSVIFGGPPKKRYLPGVGASIVPDLIATAQIDDVVMVPEIDTVRACRELFERHGLFVGASSGTAYAAFKLLAPRLIGRGTPNVLFLCADRGTAYLDTVYNTAWVNRVLLGGQPAASILATRSVES